MKRWSLALAVVLGCRGEEPARTTSPESQPSPTASATTSTAASPPTEASAAPSASPSAAPIEPPVTCSGAALTQAVFTACRTRVQRPADASKLTLTASPSKVTLAAGASVEVTFVLKNGDTVARKVDLEIPTDTGLPSNVPDVSPLDVPLSPPKLDLECIGNGGAVKTAPPPSRPNQVEVELSAGGTLTWKRKVDAMAHAWVVDRAKLAGFTGSGTPCMESNTPAAKGTRKVSVSSFVQGVPAAVLDVTIQ